MKLELSGRFFEKYSIWSFMKIRPVEAELFHAEGRTDGQKQDEVKSRFPQLCEHAW
jgi:hypothetical protein